MGVHVNASIPGPARRLHAVGLPHTETTEDYITCAYTQKIVRLGKMMKPYGWEVYIYGGEENTAECDKHIPLVRRDEQATWFGAHDMNRHYPIEWDGSMPYWRAMNARAVASIIDNRESERDLVLLITGHPQQAIMDGLPEMTACEWGVGYWGICAPFRAFESNPWRHWVYGRQDIDNGVFYDATIPNFFDSADFPLAEKKEDYLLYCGRLINRKGLAVASQIAERTGRDLVVSGYGGTGADGWIEFDGTRIEGDHIRYVGPINREERARLMGAAAATLVPTLYVEPFGGVAVESMMAGTPAITTDWGAFTETVEPGVTGYRFHTLADAARKVEAAVELDPASIQAYAQERYSLEAVGAMYDRWFRDLDGLWGKGWDA